MRNDQVQMIYYQLVSNFEFEFITIWTESKGYFKDKSPSLTNGFFNETWLLLKPWYKMSLKHVFMFPSVFFSLIWFEAPEMLNKGNSSFFNPAVDLQNLLAKMNVCCLRLVIGFVLQIVVRLDLLRPCFSDLIDDAGFQTWFLHLETVIEDDSLPSIKVVYLLWNITTRFSKLKKWSHWLATIIDLNIGQKYNCTKEVSVSIECDLSLIRFAMIRWVGIGWKGSIALLLVISCS